MYCGYSSHRHETPRPASLPRRGTRRLTVDDRGLRPTSRARSPHADLAVAEVVGDPLVHAFVTTAHKRSPGSRRARAMPGRRAARSPTAGRTGQLGHFPWRKCLGVITIPARRTVRRPRCDGDPSLLAWIVQPSANPSSPGRSGDAERTVEVLEKMVMTSMRTPRQSRRLTSSRPRAGPPRSLPRCSTTKVMRTSHRRVRAGRSPDSPRPRRRSQVRPAVSHRPADGSCRARRPPSATDRP